jgi:hypothetical protein
VSDCGFRYVKNNGRRSDEAGDGAAAEFVRFLLAQPSDERWEQIIAEPTWRPKLQESPQGVQS